MVHSSTKSEVGDCTELMKLVYACNKEKKFMRFLGGCDDVEREFNRCVMREKTRREYTIIEKFQKRNPINKTMIVPPIEESFEKLDQYPTVVERYYSRYHYKPPELPDDETHCILVHSNRICLITLAETHPIIRDKKTISSISFQISDKIDRTENKVKGKGKKGAQFMAPNSKLCFIKCADDTNYCIYGCVKGKLIEINENLLKNNQLLVNKPLDQGYIGIILPNLKEIELQKKNFTLFGNECLDILAEDELN